MIDANLKPWLIEVKKTQSLHAASPAKRLIFFSYAPSTQQDCKLAASWLYVLVGDGKFSGCAGLDPYQHRRHSPLSRARPHISASRILTPGSETPNPASLILFAGEHRTRHVCLIAPRQGNQGPGRPSFPNARLEKPQYAQELVRTNFCTNFNRHELINQS